MASARVAEAIALTAEDRHVAIEDALCKAGYAGECIALITGHLGRRAYGAPRVAAGVTRPAPSS